MLKLWVKLMLLLLVLALAGPFLIRGPDGEPLMEPGDIGRKFDNIRTAAASHWNSLAARFRGDAEPLPVYRWQDENGNWHFSDAANPDGTSELIYVDPERNVIPSSETAEAPQATEGDQLLEKIRKPLDEARDARNSLEQRHDEIEQRSQQE